MKDNQIKFGFWNYLPSDTLDLSIVKTWKDMGCNLPMSFMYDPKDPAHTKEYMLKFLDECQKQGVQCLMFDRRVSFRTLSEIGKEEWLKGVEEAKKDFYGHPAIYGFMVDDEPAMEQEDDYVYAYQVLNKEMPGLHHFGNLHPYFSNIMDPKYGTTEDRYNRVNKMVKESGCNLLAYDQYTQCYDNNVEDRKDGIKQYLFGLGKFLEIAKENGDIPVYPSILSIGHFKYETPSEDDIKWQINASLAMGAKGVIWFYFHHDLIDYGFKVETAPFFGEKAEKTEMYYKIKRQQEIFDTRYRKYFDNMDIVKYGYVNDPAEEDKEFVSDKDWVHKLDLWKKEPFLISYGVMRDTGKKIAVVTNLSQTITNCFTIFFNEKDNYTWWITPGEMILFDLETKKRIEK